MDDYYRPRVPHGFYEQLPDLASESANPAERSTLAYIVVGPRVRGRFDVEKANVLGVVGKMRSQLTNGHSVTVTFTNENGEQEERIVRPEDVIGPSEPPGV